MATALATSYAYARDKRPQPASGPSAIVRLEGDRRLDFVRSFSAEQEVNPRRSFWNRVLNVIVGAPEYRHLVRPYSIITDSRGRIIITDPGALTVHVFDFERKKYFHLDGGKKDRFQSPIGVAVDAQDNIYVTDSRLGKVFVFDANGKFRRYIGAIGNEGFFKRATGIAIDRNHSQIFVSDTLRNKIFVLDMEGRVLRQFGGPGTGPGLFNFPTEIVLHGEEVLVVDAMNFRVQIFGHDGTYQGEFGRPGDSIGTVFRPKGLAVDSDGDLYLVDASLESVQVFDRRGQLLYFFGRAGGGAGQFQLPSGIWIDENDHVYVADSYNQRVQVFQYVNGRHAAGGQH